MCRGKKYQQREGGEQFYKYLKCFLFFLLLSKDARFSKNVVLYLHFRGVLAVNFQLMRILRSFKNLHVDPVLPGLNVRDYSRIILQLLIESKFAYANQTSENFQKKGKRG